MPEIDLALPIGISFYTFQAMSYVIDVYRRRSPAQRSVLDVGLYVSFFPQLIAGPIVRYETIAQEIHGRRETWEDFRGGVPRFIAGLGKKVILSNNMAILADAAFDTLPSLSAPMAWLGTVAYGLQIYFDFSGYSDMAIGMGRMFGFHFLENFDRPYLAVSITDFWRRWHISLSTWFRDYVYIPLGGNRVSAGRHLFNLFVVWLLTGIWHGANWTCPPLGPGVLSPADGGEVRAYRQAPGRPPPALDPLLGADAVGAVSGRRTWPPRGTTSPPCSPGAGGTSRTFSTTSAT